jgi:hypothetical protein
VFAVVDGLDSPAQLGALAVLTAIAFWLIRMAVRNGRADTLSAVADSKHSAEAFLEYVKEREGASLAALQANTEALQVVSKGLAVLLEEVRREAERSERRDERAQERHREIVENLRSISKNGAHPSAPQHWPEQADGAL